jgi:magnesium chelatase family protein
MNSPAGDSTATVQRRCTLARDRALQRQGKPNRDLVGRELDDLQLSPEASQGLHQAATRWAWSSRSTHRTLKVARTIADLAHSDVITWTQTMLKEQLAKTISSLVELLIGNDLRR